MDQISPEGVALTPPKDSLDKVARYCIREHSQCNILKVEGRRHVEARQSNSM